MVDPGAGHQQLYGAKVVAGFLQHLGDPLFVGNITLPGFGICPQSRKRIQGIFTAVDIQQRQAGALCANPMAKARPKPEAAPLIRAVLPPNPIILTSALALSP